MLLIVLLLVPLLPFLAFLLLRPATKPAAPRKKTRDVLAGLLLTLLFPAEWIFYFYLLPRQQAFLGMEFFRSAAFALIIATALYFAYRNGRAPESDRGGFLLLPVLGGIVSALATAQLYVWLCNLVFLLPGNPMDRSLRVISIQHEHGSRSSHADILIGQIDDRAVKIKTYRLQGPDPNLALMTLDGHHFCDMTVVQPNDVLIAKGHANLFGFAIDRFEPENDRLRSECSKHAYAYHP